MDVQRLHQEVRHRGGPRGNRHRAVDHQGVGRTGICSSGLMRRGCRSLRGEKMILTREQILQRRPIVTEVVPAPELGEGATLKVRRLAARDFMALSEKAKAQPELAYVHWIVACVIDDAGAKVFTDDDAQAISELDITLIERLSDAA